MRNLCHSIILFCYLKIIYLNNIYINISICIIYNNNIINNIITLYMIYYTFYVHGNVRYNNLLCISIFI